MPQFSPLRASPPCIAESSNDDSPFARRAITVNPGTLLRIDWGDAGGWAQATGNLALWVIAVITLMRDRKRIRALEEQGKRERLSADQAQARLISAWANEWNGSRARGICSNLSTEPIYDVLVRGSRSLLTSIPRANERTTVSAPLIRPREELPFDLDLDDRSAAPEFVYVDICFSDAARRRWWRRGDGRIRRIEGG